MNGKLNLTKMEWDFSPIINKELNVQIAEEKKIIELKINEFVSKWKDEDFLKDEDTLKKALDEYEEIFRKYGTSGGIGFYIYLMNQKEQSNVEIKSKYSQIDDFDKQMENKIRFFTLTISKTDEQNQRKFLNSNGLSKYKSFLRRLFAKGKYTLSDGEEKILSLKDNPSYERWIKMVSEFLSREEQDVFTGKIIEKKNFSEISSLLNDENKSTRDSAAIAFNKILEKYADIATEEINSILQNKKIDDEIRRYNRPDKSRIISDDIDEEFIDSLLSEVKKSTGISKRFYELKSKLLGQKKLEYHERSIQYGKLSKKYPYDESADIVYGAIENFDEEFSRIVKKLLEEGNIDVYPKKGKRSGAFCLDSLPIYPVYILLNHTNKLQDVETLAHELGHATCDIMMRKQNSLNYGVPMSTAETHSTFFEELFFRKLFEKIENDEDKLSLLMLKLNGDVTSIIRQCHCYLFEKELHEEFRNKGYLPKEEIGKIFQKNMSAYMGEFVEQSSGSQNWWVHWPHIRQFFYVYSYASGALASKSMISLYNSNKNFKDKIKQFYSVGKSKSPREAFLDMGLKLDETFWARGLKEIEKELNIAWTLAKKLNKI